MSTPYASDPRKRIVNGVETKVANSGTTVPANVQMLPFTTFVVIPAVDGTSGVGVVSAGSIGLGKLVACRER